MHAVAAVLGLWLIVPAHQAPDELVDIEIAPAVPLPEALPPEVARPAPPIPEQTEAEAAQEAASAAPTPPGEGPVDAGVDAPIDAAPDARPDARPDAAVDARPDATPDAGPDAGIDAAPDAMAIAADEIDASAIDAGEVAVTGDAGESPAQVAVADAGEPAGDAGGSGDRVAAADRAGQGSGEGSGAGSGAGSGPGSETPAAAISPPIAAGSGDGSDAPIDTAALANALAAAAPRMPGILGSDAPAIDGAPTTAGTAANLLAYFPEGHVTTALIRFDRLRGTEWAARTEQLLRPMPDYQLLFGARDADIIGKLETLVISTPRPRDAAATTLVGRTQLSRTALRDALGEGGPVAWSVARGGLLGRRSGKRFPGDARVFLSPFPGWFLLAQPGDLGELTAPARGRLDAAVASGAPPPWLASIRTIESETGDPRGPALVVTIALGGKRFRLGAYGLGLGVSSIPKPDRTSLAMELVPQGWLVRGNLRFASDADAAEFVASVSRIQHSVADSRAIQLVLGKPIARVIAALAFAQSGPRVSYATSISIADARAILSAVAQQIDEFFRAPAAPPPVPVPVPVTPVAPVPAPPAPAPH
jgi:hypothetical protein